jgi:hypothetical protein
MPDLCTLWNPTRLELAAFLAGLESWGFSADTSSMRTIGCWPHESVRVTLRRVLRAVRWIRTPLDVERSADWFSPLETPS